MKNNRSMERQNATKSVAQIFQGAGPLTEAQEQQAKQLILEFSEFNKRGTFTPKGEETGTVEEARKKLANNFLEDKVEEHGLPHEWRDYYEDVTQKLVETRLVSEDISISEVIDWTVDTKHRLEEEHGQQQEPEDNEQEQEGGENQE